MNTSPDSCLSLASGVVPCPRNEVPNAANSQGCRPNHEPSWDVGAVGTMTPAPPSRLRRSLATSLAAAVCQLKRVRAGARADPSWAADQWVRIEGTLAERERDGDRLVTILAETIVPVKEPSNPYLTSRQ